MKREFIQNVIYFDAKTGEILFVVPMRIYQELDSKGQWQTVKEIEVKDAP